jgi:hypothetical protein
MHVLKLVESLFTQKHEQREIHISFVAVPLYLKFLNLIYFVKQTWKRNKQKLRMKETDRGVVSSETSAPCMQPPPPPQPRAIHGLKISKRRVAGSVSETLW